MQSKSVDTHDSNVQCKGCNTNNLQNMIQTTNNVSPLLS